MPVERTIGEIHRGRGLYTSQMSEPRTFLLLSAKEQKERIILAEGQYDRYRAAARAAVQAAGKQASPAVTQLQQRLADARRAQRLAVQAKAEKDAKEAAQAAERARRSEAAEKRRIVVSLRFVTLKRKALVALSAGSQQPVTEEDAKKMKLPEVDRRLRSDSTPLAKFRTILEAFVVATDQFKKDRYKEREANKQEAEGSTQQ
jgi:hypothetical protein